MYFHEPKASENKFESEMSSIPYCNERNELYIGCFSKTVNVQRKLGHTSKKIQLSRTMHGKLEHLICSVVCMGKY